jgi:hypothetical protein
VSISLKVANGDLSVRAGRLEVVSGAEKLKQDLTLWLTEKFEDDRFHKTYGSILDNYIGGVITEDVVAKVRSETLRVLANYQQLQIQHFRDDPSKYSPQELLQNVNGVDISVSYDKVVVIVRITTAARVSATVNVPIGFGA